MLYLHALRKDPTVSQCYISLPTDKPPCLSDFSIAR
uniref:Uncharacterized protein n=1 Tax=Anguilla anguilla TaxID=7936 RepID=A0A0E9WH64_ANGAN